MNIKEILQLIEDTREILIEDFLCDHTKTPSKKDLLRHINTLIKEERTKDIVNEVLLEDDYKSIEDLYGVLLVAAAIYNHATADS